MPTFTQKDDGTSLNLFCGNRVLTPDNAMIDTGSEISLMMCPASARGLHLTWTKDTARIVGVGGSGGAEGYADQDVILRIGQWRDGMHPDDCSPMQGCFEMRVRPLIMTDQVLNDIGFQVIIGQGVIRAAGGMVDISSERFHYRPGLLPYGCWKLRCSVPILASQPNDDKSFPTLADQVVTPRVAGHKLLSSAEHERRPLAAMLVRAPKVLQVKTEKKDVTDATKLTVNTTTASPSAPVPEAKPAVKTMASSPVAAEQVAKPAAAAAKPPLKTKAKPKPTKFKTPNAPITKPRDTSEVALETHIRALIKDIAPVTVAPISAPRLSTA
jgi:hypothetical protein